MRNKSNDVEQVARSFLDYVRRQNGRWVQGIEAFRSAVSECRDLPWVKETEQKPKARIAITAVIERLMATESKDIEKEKRGSARSAPVYFRVKKS